MSVMSLDWHKNCLHNMESYLIDQQARLDSFKRDVDRTKNQIDFLRMQIANANRLGKDGFDAERFLSKLRENSQKTSETP